MFKKNFLNLLYIIFLGSLSSYSLPPYNFFLINFITFSLIGSAKNTTGIGVNVTVFSDELQQSKQQFLSRGFQSSMSNKLHFGLGENMKVDSVLVDWKNGKTQNLTNIKINSM